MNLNEVIEALEKLANPEKIQFKQAKFGILANNSLGIYHKDLNELAKKIAKNDALALQLYETNIYEARILCSKIFNPKNLTEDLMDKWTSEFENWEVCDSFCMKLFAKSKWAIPKILEWTQREREFEKRAGFTVMAAYCMADKKAENEVFTSFLPIIEREADDNRIYVKKAVNWALRSIGKRNRDLQQIAIQWAKKIAERDSKAAKWITSNALKELEKDGVRISDYPRKIYRK
jgi:3-methyladenine DNA glycosylase AlkD